MQTKTARLTVLIDPARKQAFENYCYANDTTPSQVMRRLIREFLDSNVGPEKKAAPAKLARRR